MNWITWRQHRTEALIALLALVVLAIIFIPDGLNKYDILRTPGLMTCTFSNADCEQLRISFMGQAMGLSDTLSNFLFLLPMLVGVFIGAPLVARECERRTHYLAWTQGITRQRWLAVKLGWITLVTLLAFILLATLTTWWGMPWSIVESPWIQYGIRGTVPIGFALFGLMLGVACGTLVRRTVPAMALTVVIFLVAALGMGYLQPYLAPPQSHLYPIGVQDGAWGRPGDDVLYAGYADQAGHETGEISQYCHFNAVMGDPSYGPLANQCIREHHLQWEVVYQPATMFWTLQGIETAILLLLAAALAVFTFWWLRKRIA